MINTRFSWTVFCMVIMCSIFPFLPALVEPLFIRTAVRSIENIQALMLFGICIFTLVYMQPWNMPNGQKQFWFWAALWWLLLCGRSISWGRDYFPDVPKPYFRAISVVLIGSVLFMLFSKQLRQEIVRQLKNIAFPIWVIVLVISALAIVDCVEHLRGPYSIFLSDMQYQSFIEELYEFPLIFGLFLLAWPFMQKDHKRAHLIKEQHVKMDDNYIDSSQIRT